MNMEKLLIKRVRENGIVPVRATEGSAGLDLCYALTEPLELKGHAHALIPTGIAVELPSASYAAFVFPRSGMAIKHGIGLLNSVGVIDSDYRGEICVGVINQFDESYVIEPGERIAQLIVMPVSVMMTEEASSLSDTDRGAGGFGSTGRAAKQNRQTD